MILVVGASGLLGGATARLLLSQGHRVRALSRKPEALEPLAVLGAEVVRGDLLDRASLDAACAGSEQVFTTANSFLGSGTTSPTRVDRPGNRALIDAARASGVRHFVFTSAANLETFASVDYFRVKLESETYLQQSGLRWTVLRPFAFMEIWATIVGDPVFKGEPVRIVGSGTTRTNYVAVSDVAAMAALVLSRPAERNTIIEFGGPDNLTLLEVVGIFERLSGRIARRSHAPVPVMRAVAAALGLVNPVLGRKLELAVLSATVESPLDMAPVLARYPIPQTRFEDWARARYGQAARA
jgi:uncharacterized protein YbjT (DUF2867 family)